MARWKPIVTLEIAPRELAFKPKKKPFAVKRCEVCDRAWQIVRDFRSPEYLTDFPKYGLEKETCPECGGEPILIRKNYPSLTPGYQQKYYTKRKLKEAQ